MEQEYSRKKKLLKLAEYFKRETSAEHPAKTGDIVEVLKIEGISVNRRTLPEEISILNEMGYEIKSIKCGKSNAYYYDSDSWSLPEIKMLIDAVQAARFISTADTENLINKLAHLANEENEYILKTNLVYFNTCKYNNEEIQKNIEVFEMAILDRKKASFRYFDIDENKNTVYRRDGQRYMVEPIALVYHEDFYYLMTWNTNHSDVTKYRIDRISGAVCEKAKISPEAKQYIVSKRAEKYTRQAFNMFGGECKNVKLIFDDTLIGSVYDKFGLDTVINRIENKWCGAMVTVQESPTWRGWLEQFGDKMRVEYGEG